MTHTKRLIQLVMLLGASLLVVVALRAAQSGPPEGTAYAGADACATCHEEKATALKETPHGQKGFDMRSEHGCETCHGAGTAHVDGEGDTSKIVRLNTLSATEASAVCLQCHENGNRMNWVGSVHPSRNVACIDCHTIHSPKSEKGQLKTAKIEDTCNRCHSAIKGQLMRTSHHPIREGLITCVDCHNPHGTNTPKLVSAETVNDKCYECHTEKRGPYLWDHPPVRESCLNCHTPHGSNHPKLTVAKRPWLCQRCHADTRHPGTLYDATGVDTNDRVFDRSCSNCHLNIHGSMHPSGKFFLR